MRVGSLFGGAFLLAIGVGGLYYTAYYIPHLASSIPLAGPYAEAQITPGLLGANIFLGIFTLIGLILLVNGFRPGASPYYRPNTGPEGQQQYKPNQSARPQGYAPVSQTSMAAQPNQYAIPRRRFCVWCGSQLVPPAKFCQSCGKQA